LIKSDIGHLGYFSTNFPSQKPLFYWSGVLLFGELKGIGLALLQDESKGISYILLPNELGGIKFILLLDELGNIGIKNHCCWGINKK
jgi:hypothetical protein